MTPRFMEINLLPEERVRDKYSFGIQAVSFGILSILTICFGSLGFVKYQSLQYDAMNLGAIKSNQLAIQDEINKLQISLNGQSMIQSYMQGNTNISMKPLVNQIMSAMPDGTSYSDIHVSGNLVSISGTIQSLHDVAGFENSLSKMKQVSSVSVNNVTTSSQGGLSFTLKLSLGGGNDQ